MTLLEILGLSVALAMDAFAVAMTNGMVYSNVKKSHILAMPILFGIFQGIMPLAGYCAGALFTNILDKYSGIVILIILGMIGLKMVYEGLSRKERKQTQRSKLTFAVLGMQAIATSIDAFAVGVAFKAMDVAILMTISIIMAVTALLVTVAICIGRSAGDFFGAKAEILGGVILIIIGVKAIL